MNENTKRVLRTAYSALLCVAISALGVLFTVSCVGIFLEGDSPFSRESIGDALMRLLPAVVVTVVLIIGAPVVSALLPVEKRKKSAPLDASLLLSIARRKAEGKGFSEKAAKEIISERNFRKYFTVGGAVLFAVSLVYPLIHTLTSSTFTSDGDANVQVLTASVVVLVCLIPTATYAIGMSYVFAASRTREADLLKTASADGEVILTERHCGIYVFFAEHKGILSAVGRCAVVIFAVVLIALGVMNGGMNDVLEKAVKICRECIGLG